MHDRFDRLAAGFICVCLLIAGIYALALNGPFLLDDGPSLDPIRAWLAGEETWLEALLGNRSGILGRPVSMASFMLSAAIGGYEPFAFKLGNLILHVASGFVIWRLLLRLLPMDPRLRQHAAPLALVVAAVWLLHPLHVSTVLYAVQRMAQLSTLAVLLCLVMYVQGRQLLEAGNNAACRLRWFLLLPLILAAGMLSKENAAVAPLLCLVIECAWFSRLRDRRPREVSVFFLLMLLAPALCVLALLAVAPDTLLASYELREFTLSERVLTQFRVVWSYLGQVLVPRWDSMTLYSDAYLVSTGIFRPLTTATSALALVVVSAFALFYRARAPFLFASWFFFLAAHSVESTILPLELYFEHRNYLPSLGPILVLAGSVAVLLSMIRKPGVGANARRSVAILAVAILAASTLLRVLVWRSEDQLVAQALNHHPDSTRAQMSRATLALRNRDFATARSSVTKLQRAASARSQLTAAITLLTLDCIEQGAASRSRIDAINMHRVGGISLEETTAFSVLARAQSQFGCGAVSGDDIADAIAGIVDRASAQRSTAEPRWRARYIAASVFLRTGSTERALQQAELAWQPTADAAVGSVLFQVHLRRGDPPGAAAVLDEMEARIPWYRTSDLRRLQSLRTMLSKHQPATTNIESGDAAKPAAADMHSPRPTT